MEGLIESYITATLNIVLGGSEIDIYYCQFNTAVSKKGYWESSYESNRLFVRYHFHRNSLPVFVYTLMLWPWLIHIGAWRCGGCGCGYATATFALPKWRLWLRHCHFGFAKVAVATPLQPPQRHRPLWISHGGSSRRVFGRLFALVFFVPLAFFYIQKNFFSIIYFP